VGRRPTAIRLDDEGAPAFGPPVNDRAAVAAAIGLGGDDLSRDLPIQEISCGVPYLIVPLRDRETVDRATPRSDAILELPGVSRAHPAILLFANVVSGFSRTSEVRLKADTTSTEGGPAGPATTYSRMFAPGLGVLEDPATGSAAGPLGCYLVQHGCVAGGEGRQMVNVQGVKMGRASRIHISITGEPDAITGVRVGGEAVLVARGEFLAIPAPN
jgi:trans-2,3-dihydro-3-hydroxyanthranilate isomerase